MRFDKIVNGKEWLKKLDKEDLITVMDAFMQIYPMIVLVNLTRNSYAMFKGEDFLFERIEGGEEETYDDMLKRVSKHIHPDYQKMFLDVFERRHLLDTYGHGVREVEARVCQKASNGQYQWVSNHAIRVEDESGDMIHVCLCRVLSHGLQENRNYRYGNMG